MLKWLKTLFLKKRPPCIVCEEQEGELQLDDNNWICEECAQCISSHNTDMGN
ncbi:hypothetical protein P4I85_15085 [Bacillus cereus]|uniref:hypothetical protein n=1 Tax=Bacillus cereus group TaxID=86661 RepID=UPI00188E67C3|nr:MULTISPECIES: hypothetical protein [Bacillus cereus group]MEB9422713.1 hypothetical protein [Bacillus cereus]MDY7965420.1 hypothetical protein [Bacillus thuringiensis]MEB9508448.1 hypothetical protein [Bacillus cereus]MEB9561812.1 hypothetical protein [Bacillus cereus]MEC2466876.1 hypothetical protein [Bacillus cereus]